MNFGKYKIRKNSLVAKLIVATWVVLGIVLLVGASVSLTYSRRLMENQARSAVERQQEIFGQQLLETRERQRKRLEPLLHMLGALSQKPLLNRAWTGPSVQLPSQSEFVDNLRKCFLKNEIDLRYQCLSRDVELRVQASLLAANQEFLEVSILKLLSDQDIVGVIVLDIDDNPFMGFKKGSNGEISKTTNFSDFNASSTRIEEDVRIEDDPFGKVIFFYSDAFVERAREQMKQEHEKTLARLRERSQGELRNLTTARLLEGFILALAAAVAVTEVLFRGVLRPLTALRAGAELLALGNFEAPIDVSRADELGDLARSFAHMRGAIVKRIETLEKLNIFGRNLIAMRSAQEIFEACQAFWLENLGASQVKIFIKKSSNSSAIANALSLPDFFMWESVPQEWADVSELSCSRKASLSQQLDNGVVVGAVPFLIRGESHGVMCAVVLERDISFEDLSFGSTISHLASVTVENLIMLEEVRIKARMEADLNAADAVQKAIIPKLRAIPNVKVAVHHMAAEKGMGDWYGLFFDAQNRRLYLYIADVTGHGIAAALLTSLVSGVVSTSHALLERGIVGVGASSDAASHIHLVVTSINDMMKRTGESVEKSLTLAVCAINVDSGEYVFVNCAHPQPFHVSSAGTKSLLGAGVPLGLRGEPSYEVVEGELASGDRLVFVTDGLFENESLDGKTFRRMALKKQLENKVATPEMALQQAINTAQEIWQGAPAADDVTMLVVDWEPQKNL